MPFLVCPPSRLSSSRSVAAWWYPVPPEGRPAIHEQLPLSLALRAVFPQGVRAAWTPAAATPPTIPAGAPVRLTLPTWWDRRVQLPPHPGEAGSAHVPSRRKISSV